MRLSRLLSLVPLADAVPRAKRSEPAPLLIPRSVSTGDLVANQYIVKFKESSTLAAVEETIKSLSLPNGAGEVFREVFTGFAGHFDAATLDLIRSHPEDFGGRVEQIKSFIGPNDDSCGHGTHVAGTIGSNTYGVAKKTTLLGIKVIDYNNRTRECEGPTIGILRGLEYVAQDVANRNCPKGVVVNMSLGGSFSQASNDAVAELVSKGFFVAVAAGNGDEKKGPMDAGDVSPASERSACTVGASDRNDRIAHFSNYGSMIDIHAPGVDIVSLKNGGGTALGSGTSMATPHVAGLAAYFMGQGRAAAGMCEFLQNISVKNAISGMHYDTKNLLAQNDRAR
ncbi:Proteinase R [Beauveria bassiana]|nr:Proteinase R [Beauveria bassiana]